MQKSTGRLLRTIVGTPSKNTTGNTNLSNPGAAGTGAGFIVTGNNPLTILDQVGAAASTYGPGTFGFFDPKTMTSVATAPTDCCPLILAAAPIYENDFIGTLVGGYKKPLLVNIDPKRIKGFYRFDPCVPQPAVFSLGGTPYNTGSSTGTIISMELTGTSGTCSISTNCSSPTSVTVPANTVIVGSVTDGVILGGSFTICDNGGGSYTFNTGSLTLTVAGTSYTLQDAVNVPFSITVSGCTYKLTITSIDPVSGSCCYDFLCDTAYTFQVQLRGTPVYQAFGSNMIVDLTVTTPCCPNTTPATPYVDPLWVYWQLALTIAQHPVLKHYIYPIVSVTSGSTTTYYYPTSDLYPSVTIPTGALTFDNIPAALQANSSTSFCSLGTPRNAGLYLQTAYVETRFKDCTFTPKEGYTYDLIELWAGLHIWGSVHCADTICFQPVCKGHTGSGIGEYVIRDLIHSEYHRGFTSANVQNFDELRFREVEQGDQLFSLVNRNSRYYQYVIIFDNKREGNWVGIDPYEEWVVNIYSVIPIPAFETFMTTWTNGCDCAPLTIQACDRCDLESNNVPTLVSPATNA